ncbi:MAG: hypothetical protein GC134_02675 [Proteobacteria bacterium]|nr:hypothetical protein [Pseudomonadota bacterium]
MFRTFLTALALTLCTLSAHAKDRPYVPEVLKPWVEWVLHDSPEITCADTFNNSGNRTCVLGGTLKMDIRTDGATFSLPVTLMAESWVDLPGDSRTWPTTVSVDGKPAAFSERGGRPALYLKAGTYAVSGTFTWAVTPAQMRLPNAQGLLDVTVGGKKVTLPQVRGDTLWLVADDGQRLNTPRHNQHVQPDHMDVRVFRRIEDTLPAKVITLVRLTVSGKEREETLPPLLLAGTTPNSYTGSLPARLEADGSLKLQVRPGVHELTFLSRAQGAMDSLTAPAMPWGSEVWVYKPYPDLRLTEISGGQQIDPNQTDLPYEWRDLAAYQMHDGDTLAIKTQRRGAEKPPANSLTLYRTLWLDFNGDGLSAMDSINGSMWSDWRLSLADGTLTRATVNGALSPITTDGKSSGIELRQSGVSVAAESRLNVAGRMLLPTTLPINGWNVPMDNANATLNLPVGWDVLGISGVDKAYGTWVSQWNLFDVFYVLILALMVGKLWRPQWGALTLGVLLLTFQELEEVKVMLFAALVCIALVRYLPAGKLRRFAHYGRYILVAMIAVYSWPLLVAHLQYALHPQLDIPSYSHYGKRQAIASSFMDNVVGGAGGNVAYMAQKVAPGSALAPMAMPERRGAKMKRMRQENEMMMAKGMRADSFMAMDGAAAPEMAMQGESDMAEGIVSATSQPPAMNEIDPDAKLQTGYGMPDWSWRQVTLGWDGPMAAGTTAKVWLISPLLNRLLDVLAAVSFALLLARLALNGDMRLPTLPKGGKAAKAALAALLLMPVANAHASDLPSADLLAELQQRLLEAPKCAPSCAAVQGAELTLDGERISLTLQVDALDDVMVPLPGLPDNWRPASVTIDGKPAAGVVTLDGYQLYTLVRSGSRSVTLTGRMPNVSNTNLNFSLLPKDITLHTKGWQVSGLDPEGRPVGSLNLTRTDNIVQKKDEPEKPKTFAPLQFPGFVTVERRLSLDIRWKMRTIVTLQSGEPTTIRYPLLAGERMLGTLPVDDGKAVITLTRPGQRISFDTELDIADGLTLTAPEGVNWNEIWSVSIHPKWRLSYEGVTPIYHVTNNQWQPQWRPYAGESVQLRIARPLGADGQDLTVHSATLSVNPGKRATTAELRVDIETSKPRNHTITLPEGAKLSTLSLDSQVMQTEADKGKVTVALPTGRHNLFLSWREDGDVPAALVAPKIDLGAPMVANSRITLRVPEERWTLWTCGPRMGPAVLLWGILAAMAVLGFVLSKLSTAPVRGWEWFLLSLGLTQLSPFFILIPVVWVLAMHWREQHPLEATTARQVFFFNAYQVVLVLLTISAISTLFDAVKHGLLGRPASYVAGNGSGMFSLSWYQDFGTALPDVWALTLPVMAYRVLMMVWALWVALLLLRLMRWSWQSFSTGGYWKKAKQTQK